MKKRLEKCTNLNILLRMCEVTQKPCEHMENPKECGGSGIQIISNAPDGWPGVVIRELAMMGIQVEVMNEEQSTDRHDSGWPVHIPDAPEWF